HFRFENLQTRTRCRIVLVAISLSTSPNALRRLAKTGTDRVSDVKTKTVRRRSRPVDTASVKGSRTATSAMVRYSVLKDMVMEDLNRILSIMVSQERRTDLEDVQRFQLYLHRIFYFAQ
uniref:LIM zinc-binding domain-containing protein n=1 Tax=Parascaris univalens TaxID=6257 RepID=A0A915BEY7_PARUN